MAPHNDQPATIYYQGVSFTFCMMGTGGVGFKKLAGENFFGLDQYLFKINQISLLGNTLLDAQ